MLDGIKYCSIPINQNNLVCKTFLYDVENVNIHALITLQKNHRHPIVPEILTVYKEYDR